MINIKVKKLTENAVIPSHQTEGASGFDLHSTETKVIMPGETELISTGLAVAIPIGYEMQVRPRSGLSLKTGLRVANSPGTVDADYRGEVKVIITNTGHIPQYIKTGDRVAQGVICPVYYANFEQVNELDNTNRGSGGFGSTGK